MTSVALAKRRPGRRWSRRITSASSASGTNLWKLEGTCGVSLVRRMIVCASVSAAKAERPVRACQTSAPSENRSARASVAPESTASGAMYSSLRASTPTPWVAARRALARARPKSVSRASPWRVT